MSEVKGLYLFLSNNKDFVDVYRDCLAICKYIFPFNNFIPGFGMIEKFVLENRHVWERVNNLDFLTRDQKWEDLNVQPFYEDSLNNKLNLNLKERDVTLVLKEYEKSLAFFRNSSDSIKNWIEMQEDLAEEIWKYHNSSRVLSAV